MNLYYSMHTQKASPFYSLFISVFLYLYNFLIETLTHVQHPQHLLSCVSAITWTCPETGHHSKSLSPGFAVFTITTKANKLFSSKGSKGKGSLQNTLLCVSWSSWSTFDIFDEQSINQPTRAGLLSQIALAHTYYIGVRVPFQGVDIFLVKNRPEIIASEDSLA